MAAKYPERFKMVFVVGTQLKDFIIRANSIYECVCIDTAAYIYIIAYMSVYV